MARDLAIDLGTANTLVYCRGKGIVLNEPTVIALNTRTQDVLAMGKDAWQMIGRTPGYIVAVRPLRQGAITDFDITERMIRLLLQRCGVSRLNRPRVLICVPSAITSVERRAVKEATHRAGASAAYLIEQPMAAAIGAGLSIHEPIGNMVVDVGGGTSETAVISLGGVVASEAIRCGGFDIDAAIQTYVRREHGVAIGERTAEEIKLAIGSAAPYNGEVKAEVRGRELMTGMPKTVVLSPAELRGAVEDQVRQIIDAAVQLPGGGPARAGPGHHRSRASISSAAGRCCAGWRGAWPTRPPCPCTGRHAPRVRGSGGRPVPRVLRHPARALRRPRPEHRRGTAGSALGRAGPRRPGAPASRGRSRPTAQALVGTPGRRRRPARWRPAAAGRPCHRGRPAPPAGRRDRRWHRGRRRPPRGTDRRRACGQRRQPHDVEAPRRRSPALAQGPGGGLDHRRRCGVAQPGGEQRRGRPPAEHRAAASPGQRTGPATHRRVGVGEGRRQARRRRARPSGPSAPRAAARTRGVGVGPQRCARERRDDDRR